LLVLADYAEIETSNAEDDLADFSLSLSVFVELAFQL
jgi:hypothetical protein